MSNSPPEIVRCPAELLAEALALVLCELAPSNRGAVGKELLQAPANEVFYIARRDSELCGAAWGQRQSGNIAVFWPPQLIAGEDEQTAYLLAESVTRGLDETAIDMAQVLLSAPSAQTINVLRYTGFRYVADLLYMTCESDRFPLAAPEPCEVEFEAYTTLQRDRLTRLVEQTYEGTLDCTALNGVREIEDVINGYQDTGVFRPENWQFVRKDGQDIGVLLLADHPHAKHWELTYMGLVPTARGRGWGGQIARYAQWLARGARVERILVAVDLSNTPAATMYGATGFEIWDRRTVYLRFPRRQPS